MNSLNQIQVGTFVTFDWHGTALWGKVIDFLTCISNGRRHARVEIGHELPGIVHIVPLDELRTINIIFNSGHTDYQKPEVGNRRFFPLQNI